MNNDKTLKGLRDAAAALHVLMREIEMTNTTPVFVAQELQLVVNDLKRVQADIFDDVKRPDDDVVDFARSGGPVTEHRLDRRFAFSALLKQIASK